jgi:capsular polysaccharide biosynthesis protein
MLESLRQRWLPLAAGLLIGSLLGLVLATASPPTYTAVAYAIVVPDPANKEQGASASTIGIAQSYSRVATEGNVVGPALLRSGLPLEPGEVQNFVRVSASPDAPIIEIYGTRRTGEDAVRVANAVLDGLSDYGSLGPSVGYEVRSFVRARPPTDTSNPGAPFYVGLGGAVGLLIGGLVALTLTQSIGRGGAQAPFAGAGRGSGDLRVGLEGGAEELEPPGRVEPGHPTAVVEPSVEAEPLSDEGDLFEPGPEPEPLGGEGDELFEAEPEPFGDEVIPEPRDGAALPEPLKSRSPCRRTNPAPGRGQRGTSPPRRVRPTPTRTWRARG